MLHDYHLYCAPTDPRAPSGRDRQPLHPHPLAAVVALAGRSLRDSHGIVEGLSATDVVGFQTERYAHNFLRAVSRSCPARGRPRTRRVLRADGHVAQVRPYPISLDVEATRRVAASARARRRAEQLRGGRRRPGHRPRRPAGAIQEHPARLPAFELLLQRNPRLRGRVTMLAFLVPSRTGLREYGDYGRKVQAAVERINARYGRAGYRHVQLFYENDYPQALAGPLDRRRRAGQPADRRHEPGRQGGGRCVSQRDAVLVLSETAGAYDQMAEHVLPVAPADVAGTADALAVALAMPAAERARRIAGLRERVERQDIGWWLRSQLEDMARIAARRSARR